MALSVFDLFSVGIGPSSSHTVGPMRAAHRFVAGLERDGLVDRADEVIVDLYGSLRATGKAMAPTPRSSSVWLVMSPRRWTRARSGLLDGIRTSGRLALGGRHDISYDEPRHLRWHPLTRLPAHPNRMTFIARSKGEVIREREYYSIGGGFVVASEETVDDAVVHDHTPIAHPFQTGDELLARCEDSGSRSPG